MNLPQKNVPSHIISKFKKATFEMSVNSFALSTPQISTKPDNGTERGEVENATLRRTLGWHFVHFNCERQLQFLKIINLRYFTSKDKQLPDKQKKRIPNQESSGRKECTSKLDLIGNSAKIANANEKRTHNIAHCAMHKLETK